MDSATDPAATGSYLLNPTKDELGSLLRSTPAGAEVVIAYYTGHGHVDGLHYLITRDSSVRAPDFITGSATATRELPSLLAVRDPDSGRRSSPQPYLLIIVDTCFSGAGAIQITRDELSEVVDPDRTWVLVSARPTEYAQQGAFPAALRQALAESTAGRTQPVCPPRRPGRIDQQSAARRGSGSAPTRRPAASRSRPRSSPTPTTSRCRPGSPSPTNRTGCPGCAAPPGPPPATTSPAVTAAPRRCARSPAGSATRTGAPWQSSPAVPARANQPCSPCPP